MAESKLLYELFVLGRLMSQPFHGYLLRQLLGVAIGPTRQISWGVLYPLIRRLEESGLIESHAAKTGDATASGEAERQRRIYQITEAGQARFHELMAEPGVYNADYADTFAIKLSSFAYISREQQLEVLRHYRGYLLFIQKHVLTTRQRVSTIPVIRDFERVHYLRMLDHKLLLLAADLDWVNAQIAGDDTALPPPEGAGESDNLAHTEREQSHGRDL
jgi:DNA-binding PadR family transcriptional regulator